MYRLHCFSQSGNCFKVAFMLRALGQPYEAVYLDYLKGATRDPGWRATSNEMGEAPVLQDGDRVLTQSGAILTWLARRHGAFGGASENEQQEVLRWLLYDNHKFTSYFASYRFTKAFGANAPDPAVMDWLRTRVETAFGIVNGHLAKQAFMVGAAPTIADFSMSAYLFYPQDESGIDVSAQFPQIGVWLQRLRQVPGWGDPYDILPGARIAPRW